MKSGCLRERKYEIFFLMIVLESFRIPAVRIKDSLMRSSSALTKSGVTLVNTWGDDLLRTHI